MGDGKERKTALAAQNLKPLDEVRHRAFHAVEEHQPGD
jgi:hypothetical protein